MDLAIGFWILAGSSLFVSLALLIRKVGSAPASLPLTAEWIDELSIERYRPMMRLLDGADLKYLCSQSGFTPRIAAKLRVQRCQIFRGYLRCLNADFQRVCTALKVLLVQSRSDRPELAATLLRHQATFAAGMFAVHFRLFFYRWGICGVDVTSLVKTFEAMRLELTHLMRTPLVTAGWTT